MFLCVAPALAEVCDKVEPRWDPDNGPATILNEIYWALMSLPGMVVLAGIVLTILFRSRIVGAILGIGMAALGSLIFLADHDNEVRALSISEGCMTGFPTVELLFVVTGLAILLYGHLRSA